MNLNGCVQVLQRKVVGLVSNMKFVPFPGRISRFLCLEHALMDYKYKADELEHSLWSISEYETKKIYAIHGVIGSH